MTPRKSLACRTPKGIVMASMQPRIFSCDTPNHSADESTLMTMPLTVYSFSAPVRERPANRIATATSSDLDPLPGTTTSERQRPSLQPCEAVRRLANFDDLILRDAGKHLPRPAGRPPDLDLDDA